MEVKTTTVKEVTFSVHLLKEILVREAGFDFNKTQIHDLSEWDSYSEDQEFAGIKLTETMTDENI